MFDMFRNIYVLQCIRKKKVMRLKFCDATKKIIILGWWKNAMADSILSTSLFAQSVSRSIFTVFIYIRS